MELQRYIMSIEITPTLPLSSSGCIFATLGTFVGKYINTFLTFVKFTSLHVINEEM